MARGHRLGLELAIRVAGADLAPVDQLTAQPKAQREVFLMMCAYMKAVFDDVHLYESCF